MRTLLYAPAWHTLDEISGRGRNLRQEMTRAVGHQRVQDIDRAIQSYWFDLAKRLLRWMERERLTGDATHIYVDGLPDARDTDGSRLPCMVEPVRECSTPMYRLIWALYKLGGTLHGTEDPEMVARCRAVVASGKGWPRDDSGSPWLTDERDEYIARTIDETLPEGHWGVLFIGKAHSVAPHLLARDPAMRIIFVIDNPSTGQSATPLP